jgi:hypothetical protein
MYYIYPGVNTAHRWTDGRLVGTDVWYVFYIPPAPSFGVMMADAVGECGMINGASECYDNSVRLASDQLLSP